MAHTFTRVTLIGATRHLDLLLPSHQPVGILMPQVLDLLADEPAEDVAAKVLVAPDGTELSTEASLSDARVLDGASLLLCNASEAPPAAVVHDVTDLVVGETEEVPGRWTPRYRGATAGTFAAAGIWGGMEILVTALAPAAAWWILLGAAAVLLAAGAAAGRPPRQAAVGPALLGAGWLAGLGGVLHLYYGPLEQNLPLAALMMAGLSTLVLLALGLASPQPRALYSGAGTLALAAGLWTAAGFIGGDPVRTAALAALASTLLLGLLPSMALGVSGLATLDDQRAAGGAVGRPHALAAIAAAHRGLTLGTMLTALSIGAGLWLLGTDTHRQAWTVPLLLVLVVAVFLRARSFPLAAERMALYVATAVGLTALTLAALRFFAAQPWAVGLGVLAVAAAAAVSLPLELPGHTQARFRLLAKRLESAAILASVPLTVGLFGIFGQLLGSFA